MNGTGGAGGVRFGSVLSGRVRPVGCRAQAGQPFPVAASSGREPRVQ
jgi:hypothetical protein